MTRQGRGRHDLRGRGALALRQIITAIRDLLGQADLIGTAAELRALLRLDQLSVEAVRRGLRLGMYLTSLIHRRVDRAWPRVGEDDAAPRRVRWVLLLRSSWERGRAEVGTVGRPPDGAAVGRAVARWVAGPSAAASRPCLAEWRRRLLRPTADGGLPECFFGVRASVELLAKHPEGANGETAWTAARALLEASGEVADHAAIKRVARGLEYLRARGHLDAGTWRPVAILGRHPALEHPLDDESDDLDSPSPRLRWRLELLGVERPGELSRREARSVWARLRSRRRSSSTRHRAGMMEAERLEWMDDGIRYEGQEHASWPAAN